MVHAGTAFDGQGEEQRAVDLERLTIVAGISKTIKLESLNVCQGEKNNKIKKLCCTS